MTFDSQEVEWADMKVTVLGGRMKKIQSIKYSTEVESEYIYGEGNKPRGIGDGNIKNEGSMRILKSDLTALNQAARDAGYENITQIPYQVNVITINYKAAFGRPMLTDVLLGVKFTKYEKGWEQGAKSMPIDIPFMFLEMADDN